MADSFPSAARPGVRDSGAPAMGSDHQAGAGSPPRPPGGVLSAGQPHSRRAPSPRSARGAAVPCDRLCRPDTGKGQAKMRDSQRGPSLCPEGGDRPQRLGEGQPAVGRAGFDGWGVVCSLWEAALGWGAQTALSTPCICHHDSSSQRHVHGEPFVPSVVAFPAPWPVLGASSLHTPPCLSSAALSVFPPWTCNKYSRSRLPAKCVVRLVSDHRPAHTVRKGPKIWLSPDLGPGFRRLRALGCSSLLRSLSPGLLLTTQVDPAHGHVHPGPGGKGVGGALRNAVPGLQAGAASLR